MGLLSQMVRSVALHLFCEKRRRWQLAGSVSDQVPASYWSAGGGVTRIGVWKLPLPVPGRTAGAQYTGPGLVRPWTALAISVLGHGALQTTPLGGCFWMRKCSVLPPPKTKWSGSWDAEVLSCCHYEFHLICFSETLPVSKALLLPLKPARRPVPLPAARALPWPCGQQRVPLCSPCGPLRTNNMLASGTLTSFGFVSLNTCVYTRTLCVCKILLRSMHFRNAICVQAGPGLYLTFIDLATLWHLAANRSLWAQRVRDDQSLALEVLRLYSRYRTKIFTLLPSKNQLEKAPMAIKSLTSKSDGLNSSFASNNS